MNIDSIKGALTRKFGPLPAWGWALLVGVLLYYIRKRGLGGVANPETDPSQTLGYYGPYGQGYYPVTGGNGTMTTGTEPEDKPPAPPHIEAPKETPGPRGGGRGRKPKGKHKKGHKPHLTGKGSIWAPFGHKKPKPRKGYKTKGLGHGFWEYVPRSHASTKPHRNRGAHQRKAVPKSHAGPGHDTRRPSPKHRSGKRR